MDGLALIRRLFLSIMTVAVITSCAPGPVYSHAVQKNGATVKMKFGERYPWSGRVWGVPFKTNPWLRVNGREYKILSGSRPHYIDVPNTPLILIFRRGTGPNDYRCSLVNIDSKEEKLIAGDWTSIAMGVGEYEASLGRYVGPQVTKFDGRTMEIFGPKSKVYHRNHVVIDLGTMRMTKKTRFYLHRGTSETEVYSPTHVFYGDQ